MNISNTVTRRITSALLAFGVVALETVGASYVFRLKRGINKQIKIRFGVRESRIVARYFSDGSRFHYNQELKARPVVRFQDMPMTKGQWYEGRWFIENHQSRTNHYDFSVIVNGKVWRVARAYPSPLNRKSGFLNIFPGPGEKVGWKMQPEHFEHEIPNPTIITEGYGKGTSKVVAQGFCHVRMTHAGNLEFIFDKFEGLYYAIEGKNNNVMVMRKLRIGPGHGKHKARVGDNAKISEYLDEDIRYMAVEKLDGAAVDFEVRKGSDGRKYLSVWSWRPDARMKSKYDVDTQIDHTARLKICDHYVPDDTPLVSGRGELFIGGKNGLNKLNSKLNSSLFNARNIKDEPVLYVHQIIKIDNQDISNMTADYNYLKIVELNYIDDRFKVPEHEFLHEGKRNLWERHAKNEDRDGIIIWDLSDPFSGPIKMKYKHEKFNWHRATIVDFVPQSNSEDKVYPVLENFNNVRFISSGQGLSDDIKTDMFYNPNNYLGREVLYSAERHFDLSGKPFQPIIKSGLN